MQNDRTEDTAWLELSPVLDEALDGLLEPDRQVILLRFFEQMSMADLGLMLGVSEDAAKMRVSRALARLRERLGGLGATCSAALLATLLFDRAVEAAPIGLAPMLAAIRVSAPAGIAGGLMQLLSGTTAAKLLAALAAAVVVAGTALLLTHGSKREATPEGGSAAIVAPALENGIASSNAALAVASAETNNLVSLADPDPLKLLQNVRRARHRIASGIIEFDILIIGTASRDDDTNSIKRKIQFEDGHLWAESFTTQHRYVTPIAGGPEAEAIIKRADSMPRIKAIREGLIESFPSHSVGYYDGETVTEYLETDEGRPRTVIEISERSGLGVFDPRCLGICSVLGMWTTIDGCLAFDGAKSVLLIGKEAMEGNLAWHIQLEDKSNYRLDFWLDVRNPVRVLKVEDETSRQSPGCYVPVFGNRFERRASDRSHIPGLPERKVPLGTKVQPPSDPVQRCD
jgi:hypothetical protein